MNTILTDDERPKLPTAQNYRRQQRGDGGYDFVPAYTEAEVIAYADAREAAVLAKLREQEPVRDERAAFERALSANPDARFWNTSDAMFWAWQSRAAIAAPQPAVVQVPLTDENIERIAVKHEAFGFGQVDAKGFTTHGFDPDGLRAFVREILAAPQPAVVPPGYKLVPVEMLDRFPEINPSNYDHDDVCELNAWGVEVVLAATPQPSPAAHVPEGFVQKVQAAGRAEHPVAKATLINEALELLAAPEAPAQHPDDAAVDAFAQAMKDKLAAARAKGRGGWQTCPPETLSRMLRDHVEKGDPRDVANFCMFLWSLGHGIAAAPEAPAQCRAQIAEQAERLSDDEIMRQWERKDEVLQGRAAVLWFARAVINAHLLAAPEAPATAVVQVPQGDAEWCRRCEGSGLEPAALARLDALGGVE